MVAQLVELKGIKMAALKGTSMVAKKVEWSA